MLDIFKRAIGEFLIHLGNSLISSTYYPRRRPYKVDIPERYW